ncbi:MAG: hypothetical protein BWX66_01730 [Deltaproteobacteria bacterium ADurb.Bin058]|nr:MAG: hypothetical protein BWX66_01730 [Deltaproteobacteria bacterium ADurb.Bin058]
MDVAVIKQGDNLFFNQVEQGLSVDTILLGLISKHVTVTNGPTGVIFIPLRPPAIQNRAVQRTVCSGLHPAGAGCLHRPTRSVQPNINALNHVSTNVDVVIFQEYKALTQSGVLGVMNDSLNQLLAWDILWMGFSSKNKLNRSLGV